MSGQRLSFGRLSRVGRPQRAAHLNITSMLDVLVILVVFLLYNVSFEILHLSLVNASVPTIAEEQTTISIDRKAVNMTLQIKSDGFKLSGGNEYLDEKQMAKLNHSLPLNRGKYDFPALTRFLAQIKGDYPNSRNLIIVSDDDVLYETMVAAMDAARELPARSATEARPLFPDVVVSRAVR
jgi:biopolymer transport protein ExbD